MNKRNFLKTLVGLPLAAATIEMPEKKKLALILPSDDAEEYEISVIKGALDTFEYKISGKLNVSNFKKRNRKPKNVYLVVKDKK